MKPTMASPLWLPWFTGLCLLALPCFHVQAGATETLEADWLRQAELMSQPLRQENLQPADDAAGGCDGVKEGTWGFHTANEPQPWWQVDLGSEHALAKVVLWNRGDELGSRNSRIQLRLSSDARNWRTVYTNPGRNFGHARDGQPLVVPLADEAARWVRVQLPDTNFLHLDEVEVYGPSSPTNLALHRPATQSSISPWSRSHQPAPAQDWSAVAEATLKRLERIVGEDQGREPSDNAQAKRTVSLLRSKPARSLTRADYLEARRAERELVLAQPEMNFDDLLFVQRAPGTYSHMSDQFYGWWSRPGGGLFALKHFKSVSPQLVCLTPNFSAGSFLRPDLSYDGRKILFAWCRHYPNLSRETNKTDKRNIPEDAFYHLYEMNVDGSEVRQLTTGKYNDFDGRYLPNGEIVFLSTRRGQAVQVGVDSAMATVRKSDLPDSYVRCGGGDYRPVAVYTLHVLDRQRQGLRAISAFENFEWSPSVAADGRILFARWDYVDRHNQPYMSLWSCSPDGTNPQLVYGNTTRNPLAVFEARSVPSSPKLMFTASAHHSITAGSLVLLDPTRGLEDLSPLKRFTPEVCFPESEGWPTTWYASPWPLSEKLCLAAWSDQPLRREGQDPNPANALGLYVCTDGGSRELIYRDPAISSLDPIPLRPRATPPVIASQLANVNEAEGQFLLLDARAGLPDRLANRVRSLRIVAVPAKTQPQMNQPILGVTAEDPGKCVLGTVPVESDGSAHFRVPAGVNVFFQLLDQEGFALQTMRTVTYVQPGQSLSCVGCHEPRQQAPSNRASVAALRPASTPTPGPDGSWPLRFDRLVQPVLDQHCVRCHGPGGDSDKARRLDLTAPDPAYEALVAYGQPSLRDNVRARWLEGASIAGEGPASGSRLLHYLSTNAAHVEVRFDGPSRERLLTWMDTYAQRLGSFSAEQERLLDQMRNQFAVRWRTSRVPGKSSAE